MQEILDQYIKWVTENANYIVPVAATFSAIVMGLGMRAAVRQIRSGHLGTLRVDPSLEELSRSIDNLLPESRGRLGEVLKNLEVYLRGIPKGSDYPGEVSRIRNQHQL